MDSSFILALITALTPIVVAVIGYLTLRQGSAHGVKLDTQDAKLDHITALGNSQLSAVTTMAKESRESGAEAAKVAAATIDRLTPPPPGAPQP